jgi:hypothetical protein
MKLMEGETEVGSWIEVLKQERDTNTGYPRCQSVRDADAKGCDAKRAGC